MGPYTKAAVFLIRLVGFGLIAVALSFLAGDLSLIMVKHEEARTAMLGFETGLFVLGIAILVKSSSWGRRLTQDFEDE